MRFRLGLSVALIACVAACQGVPVVPKPTSSPMARPKASPSATTAPSASPSASADATAAASPSPSATAASPSPSASPVIRKLKKPTGEVLTLTGQVRIDAHYLNASRSGGIISHNGSGLGVVGNATLVSNNGGTLISNNGGGVISAGAGNVISNNSGGLISDKGLGYYLFQAATDVAVGAILPVAGLEIRAQDIADGKPLSIGVDEDGKPVYAIFSNAEGAFEVYLPAGTNGLNVLLTARPPTGTDARLNYERYVNQKAASAVIDEDTALITNYIREAFARQLDELFIGKEGEPTSVSFLVEPALRPAYDAIQARFATAANTIKAREMPRAKRLVITRRAADALLAFVDLEAIKFEGTEDKVLQGIIGALKDVREASAVKLAANPAFFTQQDYMIEANAQRPADEPAYEVLKPTDVGDFINRWIMGTVDKSRETKLDRVLASVGAPASHRVLMVKADYAITMASSLTLLAQSQAVDAVEKAILAGAP